jgi:predicted nucleotide-binding protein
MAGLITPKNLHERGLEMLAAARDESDAEIKAALIESAKYYFKSEADGFVESVKVIETSQINFIGGANVMRDKYNIENSQVTSIGPENSVENVSLKSIEILGNDSKESEAETANKQYIPMNKKFVFIGHGRSQVWRDLKDFLHERLNLPWDEFNREPTAGYTTKERLEEMLENACFAFLIMTAEDEHADEKLHARENVIHEIGLFQGQLGFRKAIILLEDGCQEFSNIIGVVQIRFPKGNIKAEFEEIRRVLEREEILS